MNHQKLHRGDFHYGICTLEQIVAPLNTSVADEEECSICEGAKEAAKLSRKEF